MPPLMPSLIPIPSASALLALRHTLHPRILPRPFPIPPTTHTQIRHATLLRRPKRPYTFTQLVTLSDGSAFTLRTTSPKPVYASAKDIRNTALWNPSLHRLLNVEEDEAGKLASFRAKFGRGWDAEDGAEGGGGEGEKADHLMDLISGGQGKGKGKKGTAVKGAAGASATTKATGTPSAAPAKPADKK